MPPSRQVLLNPTNPTSKKTDHVPEKLHPPVTKPAETPMGQWKPLTFNFKCQDWKHLKQIWKRVENVSASLTEPQENSGTDPKSINVLTTAEVPDLRDQLLGDRPDQVALSIHPLVRARQTNSFNPAVETTS